MKVSIVEMPMPEDEVELRYLMDYLNNLGVAYIFWITRKDGKRLVGSVREVDHSSLSIQPWNDDGPIPSAVPVVVGYAEIDAVEVERTG